MGVEKIFSLAEWQGNHPSDRLPGERIDSQFDNHANAIRELEARISRLLRADGKLAHDLLTVESFPKNLHDDLSRHILADARKERALAEQALTEIEARKREIEARLAEARAFAAQSSREFTHSLDLVNSVVSLQADLHARVEPLAAEVQAVADGFSQQGNAVTLSASAAENWAAVSMEWAEHMPGILPANILATSAVTGDHWSSRWWANQAAAIATGATTYRGAWNPVTNVPVLATGGLSGGVVARKGDYYVVSLSGTSVPIDGLTTWVAGNYAISTGSAWQRVQVAYPASYPGANGMIDVTTVGIVGNGVTDDSAAWDAAAQAAVAAGLALFVPGNCSVTLDGAHVYSGLRVVGADQSTSRIVRKPSAVSNAVLQGNGKSGIRFRNLTIDGTKASQTVPASTFLLTACYDVEFDGCVLTGGKGTVSSWGIGIQMTDPNDTAHLSRVYIHDCVFTNNDGSAINLGGTVFGATISDNLITQNGVGIVIRGLTLPAATPDTLDSFLISHNQVTYNTTHGIVCADYATGGTTSAIISGPGASPQNRFTIIGNVCSHNGQYGLSWQGTGGTVTGNTCSFNGGVGFVYAGILANCMSSTISGNICDSNEFYGIDAGGCYQTIVSHNICRRNGVNSAIGGYGINLGAARQSDCVHNFCENNGIATQGNQIAASRIDGGAGAAFPFEATQLRINDNTLITGAAGQRSIGIFGDVRKVEVCRNKVYGVTSDLTKFVIESQDCLVRGNHCNETSVFNGFATGTALLIIGDWVEEILVNVSGATTISNIITKTMNDHGNTGAVGVGGVTRVDVTGAVGYTANPTVVFSGGTGSGATAHAAIDNTGSFWVIMDTFGSYTVAPSVSFTGGGGGSGAVGTVSLGLPGNINGRELTVLFTGPVTLTNSVTLQLAGQVDKTTTGRSMWVFRGMANSWYQVSLADNLL